MATVPPYANAIAFLPGPGSRSQSIKAAGNFVARHTRKLQARPEPFFYQHVAVADPAGFHFYAHLPRPWFGNIAFNQLKIAGCFANLGHFHRSYGYSCRCHSPPMNSVVVEGHLPCSLELSAAIGNRQVQYCALVPKV